MYKNTKMLKWLLIIGFLLAGSVAHAELPILNPFITGSYQQIVKKQAQSPFVVIIWSITCPSCIKDMKIIKTLHQKYPDIKMILLAADTMDVSDQIQDVLNKQGVSELENWVYAEDNTQKLNYEVDPKWYGELPRTYFFNAQHQFTGVSGVMSLADFEGSLQKISVKH